MNLTGKRTSSTSGTLEVRLERENAQLFVFIPVSAWVVGLPLLLDGVGARVLLVPAARRASSLVRNPSMVAARDASMEAEMVLASIWIPAVEMPVVASSAVGWASPVSLLLIS